MDGLVAGGAAPDNETAQQVTGQGVVASTAAGSDLGPVPGLIVPALPGNDAGKKAAAFFDLDKTIIATSASAAFTRPLYREGVVSRSDVLRTAYANVQYLLGSADEDNSERMRKTLSELATGWDVDKVRQVVAEAVAEHINPYVYAEAVKLIAEHHELGHDVVIVSASGSDLVEPIAAMLGADHVIATIMAVEDGHYTGEIKFYAYGENKAVAIREMAKRYDYDLAASYAYSDSVTDEPMLSAVGHGTVINADKGLRRLAAERGWDLLTFTRPVRLRSALTESPARAALFAAGAGAVGVGVVKLIQRRVNAGAGVAG